MAAFHLFPSSFSAQECEQAIRRFRALGLQEGKLADGAVNRRIRRSQVAWPSGADPFCRRAAEMAREANAADWRLALDGEPDWQFTQYQALDAGTYLEHMDCSLDDRGQGRSTTRKLSVAVQLSSPASYRGGALRLGGRVGKPDEADLRAQGSVLVFPSFVPHGVSELLHGTRCSLVGWFPGPHWR